MHVTSRALPLALGWWSTAFFCAAQTPALPPIFAPTTAVENADPAISFRNAAPQISGRARDLINAASSRVLAETKPFESPVQTRGPQLSTSGISNDALLMD